MARTGPTEEADIESVRTPIPSSAMASIGRPAISPHTDTGFPEARHCSTSQRRKLSIPGESTS